MLLTEIVVGLALGVVMGAVMAEWIELTGPLDRPTDTLWQVKEETWWEDKEDK